MKLPRRKVVLALPAGISWIACLPALSQAQAGRTARLGILIAETAADQAERLSALQEGLLALGWRQGSNLVLEVRTADGRYEQLPGLATELVRSRVDVLVAFGIKALVAVRDATNRIPIVIPATSSDLVAMGIIRSLARPGGNITGITTFGSEIMGKRLEIVRDIAPRASRVAVLLNPANSSFAPALRLMEGRARSLKLRLQSVELSAPDQIDVVFATMAREHIEAIVVQDDTLFAAHARKLAEAAVRHGLPLVGGKELAEAGGLIGYGRDETALYRRAAHFVDRILKGMAPGDLPVEQATRFHLTIHLGTARTLGLRIPDALRLRADAVLR